MNVEEILVKLGLDMSPFSRGMREAKAEAESSSKKFEFLGMNMRELRKSANELGREFPLLGKAAMLAITPIGAAVGIAIAAFGYFKTQIDAMNASFDAMGERNAEALAPEALKQKRDALEQATKQFDEYLQNLQKAATNEHDFADALERTISALKKKSEAEREVFGFQNRMAGNVLEQRFRAGQISEADFIRGRGELAKQEARQEDDRQLREKKAELDALKTAQQSAVGRQGTAGSAAIQAAARIKALQDAAAAAREKETSTGAMLEKAKADSADANKQTGGIVNDILSTPGGFLVGLDKIALAQDMAFGTYSNADSRQKDLDKARNQHNDASRQAAAAESAVKAAQDAAKPVLEAGLQAAKDRAETDRKLTDTDKEYTDLQKQIIDRRTQREKELDFQTQAQLAAGGGAGTVPGVSNDARNPYLSTVEQLANSVHWVTQRMSGAGRSFWSADSPFAADARQMLQLGGQARDAYRRGDVSGGDDIVSRINNIRSRLVSAHAIASDPKDIADYFLTKLNSDAVLIRIMPRMGD